MSKQDNKGLLSQFLSAVQSNFARTSSFAFYITTAAATQKEIDIPGTSFTVPKLTPEWAVVTYGANYVRGLKDSSCHEKAALTSEFTTYALLGVATAGLITAKPEVAGVAVPVFLGLDLVAAGEMSPIKIIEEGITHTIESIFCT